MKLRVQHIMDATLLVSQIIRDKRPCPQKGKYRLARLHAKLLPEFTTINAQRDEMIKAYDFHPMVAGPKTADDPLGETLVAAEHFGVPTDKTAEFVAAWSKIAADEIEIDVEPIPLAYLDLGDGTDGSIEASELIVLGELVRE